MRKLDRFDEAVLDYVRKNGPCRTSDVVAAVREVCVNPTTIRYAIISLVTDGLLEFDREWRVQVPA